MSGFGRNINLGILVSGGGSNFEAIDNAIRSGNLQGAQIAVLVSDKEDAPALQKARDRGIPAFWVGEVPEERDDWIKDTFEDYEIDLGIAAGYLKLIGGKVLEVCEIMNIHPGPLPRFGGKGMHGLNVHRAVIDSGLKWSGPTVHMVNEVYDEGQILAHRQVPVLPGDKPEDLAARVLAVEHDLYWCEIGNYIDRGRHPIDRDKWYDFED